MSATNAFETGILNLIFANTNYANVGDATGLRGSTTAGSFYISLHTADPGEAGSQTTSEASYTGYARVAVARSGAGFTVAGNSVTNAATITFGACTAGLNTLSHFGIGSDVSGAGNLFFKGALGSALGPFTGATSDTITIPGLSGVVVDDRISFYANDLGVLPTGMTEGTIYFVKTVSGDAITISTTSGGATVDLTTSGDGFAFKHSLLAVSAGITPSFAASALTVTGG